MTLAAEGLLSNKAQIPSEALLVGQLETPKVVSTGTRALNNVVRDSNAAHPDALMT